MQPLRFVASLALAALLAAPCIAQQYTVKRMVFKGAAAYQQAQLEAVAALKPGQRISTKEMGEASQRLMDTGLFADVETTLDGPMTGINVIFKLKPTPTGGFYPVSFENFAWLTPEERDAALRAAVPLYTGRLPAAGNLQAGVQVALTDLLAKQGVQAKVEAMEEPSTETRPTPVFAYRVTSPNVIVDAVRLQGVSPQLAAAEGAIAKSMIGNPLQEGIDKPLGTTLLQPYLDAGYIHATLEGLTRSVAPLEAGTAKVTISGRVAGGEAYRLNSITWAGSDLFSSQDFAASNKLHPGDIASDTTLRASYKPLLDAYLAKGYVDVSIDTQPVTNDAAHTVAYTLKVAPGPVYKVGSLTVVGLAPEQRAAFDKVWPLPVGAVYDGVATFKFLPQHQQQSWLSRYAANVVTTANPDTGLVDIVFTFAPVR